MKTRGTHSTGQFFFEIFVPFCGQKFFCASLWLNVGGGHLVPIGDHLVRAAEDRTRT